MTSLVDQSQEIIDLVSDWAVDQIHEITDKLTLGSGPFGHVKLTPAEQLAEYAKVENNAQAWFSRIESTAQTLIGELKGLGVPETDIMKLSPYTIAIKVQAKYWLDMQKLRGKNNAV